MKVAKVLYNIISIVPFIWFVTFLLQLVIGIIHFKTIPKEYVQGDPESIGLFGLSYFSSILLILSFIMVPVWIIMSITLLSIDKKALTKLPVILSSIGVAGFFIFRYCFPDVFGWVLD